MRYNKKPTKKGAIMKQWQLLCYKHYIIVKVIYWNLPSIPRYMCVHLLILNIYSYVQIRTLQMVPLVGHTHMLGKSRGNRSIWIRNAHIREFMTGKVINKVVYNQTPFWPSLSDWTSFLSKIHSQTNTHTRIQDSLLGTRESITRSHSKGETHCVIYSGERMGSHTSFCVARTRERVRCVGYSPMCKRRNDWENARKPV